MVHEGSAEERQVQIDIVDLMSRSAYGRMLEALREGQRQIRRIGPEAQRPIYVVLTEAGQTVVTDEVIARSFANGIANSLEAKSLVVQIIAIATPEPKPAEPQS